MKMLPKEIDVSIFSQHCYVRKITCQTLDIKNVYAELAAHIHVDNEPPQEAKILPRNESNLPERLMNKESNNELQ